jgi:Ras-related C3 botulinum toxin substrate 1
LSYPHTDIFLLCYSVVDVDSFDNIVSKWIPEIRNFSQTVPVILVGTKEEIRDESEQKGIKVVSTKMGEEMAAHIQAKSFIECSAKDSYHISNVFHDTLLTFILVNSTQESEEKKNCIIN